MAPAYCDTSPTLALINGDTPNARPDAVRASEAESRVASRLHVAHGARARALARADDGRARDRHGRLFDHRGHGAGGRIRQRGDDPLRHGARVRAAHDGGQSLRRLVRHSLGAHHRHRCGLRAGAGRASRAAPLPCRDREGRPGRLRRTAMSPKSFLLLAAVIFTIVAVLQLSRAVAGWDITVGTAVVPLWASWVAAVIAGILAWLGFGAAREL